jgi:hypothetical protein
MEVDKLHAIENKPIIPQQRKGIICSTTKHLIELFKHMHKYTNHIRCYRKKKAYCSTVKMRMKKKPQIFIMLRVTRKAKTIQVINTVKKCDIALNITFILQRACHICDGVYFSKQDTSLGYQPTAPPSRGGGGAS